MHLNLTPPHTHRSQAAAPKAPPPTTPTGANTSQQSLLIMSVTSDGKVWQWDAPLPRFSDRAFIASVADMPLVSITGVFMPCVFTFFTYLHVVCDVCVLIASVVNMPLVSIAGVCMPFVFTYLHVVCDVCVCVCVCVYVCVCVCVCVHIASVANMPLVSVAGVCLPFVFTYLLVVCDVCVCVCPHCFCCEHALGVHNRCVNVLSCYSLVCAHVHIRWYGVFTYLRVIL